VPDALPAETDEHLAAQQAQVILSTLSPLVRRKLLDLLRHEPETA
jgi:hypothetical protein